MDIVGGFRLADGTSAKALTGIDDHSWMCVCATLIARERTRAVCDGLRAEFLAVLSPGRIEHRGRRTGNRAPDRLIQLPSALPVLRPHRTSRTRDIYPAQRPGKPRAELSHPEASELTGEFTWPQDELPVRRYQPVEQAPQISTIKCRA